MQINAKKLPGVARFPVDQWKEDGRPCLDTAGWYALCRKIATKDMDNLGGIFDLAETYLEQQFGPEETYMEQQFGPEWAMKRVRRL